MTAGANIFSRADPRARGLGYVNWSGDPANYRAAAAAANQEVEAKSIWLPFGVPVGNIVLSVSTAGSGTVPTGFFVAIGNGTKILAQSSNLNSSGSLTATGLQKFALSATYKPAPADSETGVFYVIILQNAAFSVTNVQFARTGGILAPPTGGAVDAGRAGTAQTALPATGSVYSSALAAAGGQDWFVGCMP